MLIYKVYGLVYFMIMRDDNIIILFWFVVNLKVFVILNIRIVLVDNQIDQFVQFIDDGKFEVSEINQIKVIVVSFINGFQEKIIVVEDFKKKVDVEGNEKVFFYVEKVIQVYQDVIEVFNKIIQIDVV